MDTPKALATESAVMSSWVGPMPPVVKTMIVAMTKRVHRRHDLGLDVRNDAHFAQIDAEVGEVLGDVADVLVLRPAGQDFVADDQDGSGDDGGRVGVHGPSED